MDLGLHDKTVLVFAGSKGLGLGIGRAFAAEGARVALVARDTAALAKAADGIAAAGHRRPEVLVGDVTDAASIAAVSAEVASRLGPVYTLVCNTGGPPAGGFDQFDDAAWQKAFELTLLAYVRMIRATLPGMKAQGGGRILMTASSSTRAVLDNLLLSNVFRTGVRGLAKSMARELGPSGILVNVLSPGRIATDRVAQLDAMRAGKLGIAVDEARARLEKDIPLGRYGTPDEFGRVAAFLGSPANTYVTGENLLIDGAGVPAL